MHERQAKDADAADPLCFAFIAREAYDPAMTELSKILPPDLENWIESRVAEGRYFDAGDYLRDLVRRDRAEIADAAWVRAMIAEGEASGYLDANPEDIIEEIIAERRSRRG